jgi:hypothetical protein
MVGYDVFKNRHLAIFVTIIWFILWFRVFVTPKRYRRILQKFADETTLNEIIGGIITIVYMVISFVVFIKIISG